LGALSVLAGADERVVFAMVARGVVDVARRCLADSAMHVDNNRRTDGDDDDDQAEDTDDDVNAILFELCLVCKQYNNLPSHL
jgi:hypothetical protein